MSRLSYLLLLGISVLSFVRAHEDGNTVYLIRHGEKPRNDGQGLSPAGVGRAACVRDVFGPKSKYNIGYILAQKPNFETNKRIRALQTVTPLSYALDIDVDTSCDRDDEKCVADAIEKFAKHSDKNILVCWEHKALQKIMKEIGVKDAPKYPGGSFDLIYTVRDGELDPEEPTSEECQGLDDK